MSFGEFLTKVAIFLTCYSAVKGEIWSVPLAWSIGGVLVALSFIRDASIRWREAYRLAPGFGFWFIVTALIVCVPNAVFKKLIGSESWGFTYWESVAAAGVIAMFFKTFVIVCESISRWVIWMIGFDNKRIDDAHRYFQKQRWEWIFGSSEEQYDDEEWPDADDEDYDEEFAYTDERGVTVVDGTIARCPDCGEPYTHLGECLVCAEFEPPTARYRRCRLN